MGVQTNTTSLRSSSWINASDTSNTGASNAVGLVNAATSVRCLYYSRFAHYLFNHDLDVMLFDYRGSGFADQRCGSSANALQRF